MSVADFHRKVECGVAVIDLRNGFTFERNTYPLGKIGESNPVTGQHFPTGNDLQLGAFDLLLDHHVGNSVDVGDSLFDFLTERIHFVEVFTEELDGDIGLRSREHGIDTV